MPMSDDIGHWLAAFIVLAVSVVITLVIWQEARDELPPRR